MQRVLTKEIYRRAALIPICVADEAGPVQVEVVLRSIASSEPRSRPCATGIRRDPALPTVDTHTVLVLVRSIERRADGQLIIHAGYWCGGLCGDDTAYSLSKTGDHWVITHEEFMWIS